MELANGPTLLHQLINLGHLHEFEARTVFSDLVSAVLYLHEDCHVVHRDIKLDNVVFSLGGRPKLLDFGFANIRKDENHLFTTNCGSIEYAAPELFTRKPYSFHVDVWSLGIVLYAMLSGRIPFVAEAGNTKELVNAIVNQPLAKIECASGDVNNLLQRMLMKDMDSRITLREVLEHPWMSTTPIRGPSFSCTPKSAEELHMGSIEILAPLYNMSPDVIGHEIVSDRTSKVAVGYRITLTVLESGAMAAAIGFFPRKRALTEISRRKTTSPQPRRISAVLPQLRPDCPSPAPTLTTTLPFSKIAHRTRRLPQMFTARPASASEKSVPL
jgi:serine/threonine protein kinase